MVNIVLQLSFNENYKKYDDHHIYKWGKLTYFIEQKTFSIILRPGELHWYKK